MNTQIFCFKCSNSFPDLMQFSDHFNCDHSNLKNNKNTVYYCRQGNCRQHFVKFSGLTQHIKKSHIFYSDTTCPMETETITPENVEKSKHELHDDNVRSSKPDLTASACEMIASLRTSSTFTGAALNVVTDAVGLLLSDISSFVKEEIADFLNSQNIGVNVDVQKLMGQFEFHNLFKGLRTLKSQTEAVKRTYSYIEPLEVPLSFRFDKRFNK